MRGKPLSPAEQTLVREMGKTLPYHAISSKLGYNVKTVKKYIHNDSVKLNN